MSYEEKIKIYQNMIRNLEIELKHYEGTPYFEDEEFKIRERINMHKEELRLYSQAAKADEYEAKAKAFDEIKNSLHDAQSSIDRSGNRKEERDHAVAFFNGLVEMDILEVYERNERDD